ncbi:hypothetical protein [Acetivibrio saccincola]|uniref:5-bromo-4-chloroindolyl phosphate hydrolysis protein n=1 Tax=Acetivibrio saccincola TaxID=1677857 RepID=A0A2K9EE67_9FIRM|nr:hypothetical protein [Acetivibrio saccincola]AUG57515.1 hypothetical protein HVS_08025 [Acetivibrio saccincola]NLW26013.1 hypothetical protein [Acetivibrio saccincola]PQQ67430.1 hypothetical protein B9R14_12190 [Acetivibrio saccincola]HOA96528.1 hypothetical protein [Acetivibrio saccincola]HQD29336.1 hypothetical protein [Acetivibrio saccincola]
MIFIFRIFKRKKEEIREPEVKHNDEKHQVRETLNASKKSLIRIEEKLLDIKDHNIFSDLLSFLSYYYYIINFYNKNIEKIISVKELMLLKYIDMLEEILVNLKNSNDDIKYRKELKKTLHIINEKLYTTCKDINEKSDFELDIDLKTLQDLIKSDF